MTSKMKFVISVGLVAFGIVIRLLPHLWNFTPVVAIALFAGFYLGARYAIALPLITMFLSDFVIGFYRIEHMIAVYGSFALVGVLALVARRYQSIEVVAAASIFSSTLFFLITNWAVWRFGTFYPPNLTGLLESYVLGLPFFRNALLGDFFYTGVFFGAYEIARRFIWQPKTVVKAGRA